MERDEGLLNRLRSRGQEVLTQVSAELSQNPRFMHAVAGAVRGKKKLEKAVGRALQQMNVPSRAEWKRVVARIDALEKQLEAAKRKRTTSGRRRAASAGAGKRR